MSESILDIGVGVEVDVSSSRFWPEYPRLRYLLFANSPLLDDWE